MAGFTTNRSQKWNGIITAMFALAWAGAAQAATLNVDINDGGCDDGVGTPYCTIQAAIDDANPGDTILVYDGTYDIIDINVENLTVISLNGAATTTIEYTGNTDTTPVVAITADGVTLGGAAQGFTIDQQDAGGAAESGNAGVKLDGSVVGLDSVTIQNNTFIGNDSGAGVLVIPPIENGHLVVQNNTFEKDGGATWSFTDIFHFHFADFGGNVGNAAAHTATIDLLNNIADDYGRSGVYFHHDLYSSTVNITGSTFDGNGADYGIYFADDLRAFSNVTIDSTTFNDVEYGMYMSGGLETQSSMSWVNNSMVTDFHDSGLYISGSVDELSTLTIDSATFAGVGSASYGVYISGEVEQGATFTLTDSTISGFDDYGVYVDAEDGGAYAITGNTITGSSARYGIYVDHSTGGQGLIDDNTITGFGDAASTSYGIYVSDQYEGTIVDITNNTITADASASNTYGVYFNYAPGYGASGSFSGNTVSGFNYAGMYVDDGPYYGSDFDVDDNTFTAHADGSDYGIYWDEIYDGSHATF
ncbi:MAG: DUF1565 domain-containing protein, partial [Planctomycetes bacterium]|nr:DUF1565 domain-containing protein [Planctomycetota bacterium]